MRISFRAKTNKEYVMVNTAVFELKCGIRVTVDRDRTDAKIADGILDMEWSDCYLWEINDISIFNSPTHLNENTAKLFEGAKLITLNLEEDAENDYEISDVSFCIS